MSINRAMQSALKAITRLEPDVKKTFKLERQVRSISGRVPPVSPEYTMWDRKVDRDGYSIPVRIFLPARPETPEVLLFFHGGGWVLGDIDSYSKTCANLAKHTRRTLVSVDYRLAPEHRFPAAAEDCYAVAKEMFSGGILGAKPEQIILIGDSAGGNLAAVVSLMARDRGEFLPKKQILFYPAVNNDHSETSPFPSVAENGTDYLLTAKRVQDMLSLYKSSDADLQNPYFAPLMADNLRNQPDTLLITAEYDLLRDEGEYYGRRLAEDGNKVAVHRMPDALHGYICLPPLFSLVEKTYALINQFLDER